MIIPTRNRAGLLGDCIESVLSQSVDSQEILIMDDSSSDETSKVTARLEEADERVKVSRSPRHEGLAVLLNRAVRRASTPHVLMVCDRMVLAPDCLERLILSIDDLSSRGFRPGAIGPALIGSGLPQGPADAIVSVDQATGEIYHSYWTGGEESIEVPTLHHWCLISRAAFLQAGGYCALFKGNHWRLDSDLYQRLRKLGYALFFEPRSKAEYRRAAFGGNRIAPMKLTYYTTRNHLLYLIRNYPSAWPKMGARYVSSLIERKLGG